MGRHWGLSFVSPPYLLHESLQILKRKCARMDKTMLIPQVWESWVPTLEHLTLPHYTSLPILHPSSSHVTHSIPPVQITLKNSFLARASAWLPRLHVCNRLGTPPPRPTACCVVVTWSGRALTSGTGEGLRRRRKGGGGLGLLCCCRRPEAVQLRPQLFQPRDNVVSFSRAAAASAQQQ